MLTKRPTQVRALTAVSMSASLGFFLIFVVIGIVMRMNQGGIIKIEPERFYGLMTAHGLGMAASLFIGSYTSAWYLLSKYVRVSTRLMWFVFLMNLLGFIGLLISTVIGNFGPGWYMLYPLPFILDTWHPYTVTLIIFALVFWGFSWLFIMLDILRAIGAEYGTSNMLGWQYLKKNPADNREIPPIILISSVSSIAGIIAMFSGANLLVLYLLKWENLNLNLDPLLLKNMVFLFGHTLVNITLYYCFAGVYEILPKYTGRVWKTNKIVVYSWNATLVLVVAAFLHHMSMDFDQSFTLQAIGQIASYVSCIPATVVTVIGAFAQIYKSGMKFYFTPVAFILGLMGWTIGGFAAMVDSTIPVNITFHNTLWVPGHFHTYFLMGVVLMLLGFMHYYSKDVPENLTKLGQNEKAAKFSLALMLVGGYGFVLMFFIAGASGVPRRFADYNYVSLDSIKNIGVESGYYASIFAVIFLLGLVIRFKSFFGNKKT